MAVLLWMSPNSVPVQPFNALIIPILRDCFAISFHSLVPLHQTIPILYCKSGVDRHSHRFLAFVFSGHVLGIDMNCGYLLYQTFYEEICLYACFHSLV